MKQLAIGLCFLLFVMSAQGETRALYPFKEPQKAQQFQTILHNLRCLVCQNQDLVDSSAKLAIDLKNQVYTRLQQGESETAIYAYLTKRYGDFVLFKPRLRPLNYVLWFLPIVLMVLALAVFGRRVLGFRGEQT